MNGSLVLVQFHAFQIESKSAILTQNDQNDRSSWSGILSTGMDTFIPNLCVDNFVWCATWFSNRCCQPGTSLSDFLTLEKCLFSEFAILSSCYFKESNVLPAWNTLTSNRCWSWPNQLEETVPFPSSQYRKAHLKRLNCHLFWYLTMSVLCSFMTEAVR